MLVDLSGSQTFQFYCSSRNLVFLSLRCLWHMVQAKRFTFRHKNLRWKHALIPGSGSSTLSEAEPGFVQPAPSRPPCRASQCLVCAGGTAPEVGTVVAALELMRGAGGLVSGWLPPWLGVHRVDGWSQQRTPHRVRLRHGGGALSVAPALLLLDAREMGHSSFFLTSPPSPDPEPR